MVVCVLNYRFVNLSGKFGYNMEIDIVMEYIIKVIKVFINGMGVNKI